MWQYQNVTKSKKYKKVTIFNVITPARQSQEPPSLLVLVPAFKGDNVLNQCDIKQTPNYEDLI